MKAQWWLCLSMMVLQVTPSHQMYPPSKPRITHRLSTQDGLHELHIQEHGNPNGPAALFVHGGPGAACNANHARFFDPEHYRIVLLDQRGCGQSTPRGSLQENNTPKLVADIEQLRQQLGLESWAVLLGGSWGVTLALCYAQAHPNRVQAMVLRGICLMRPQEIDHLFGETGRARELNPEGWSRFAAHVADDVSDAAEHDADSRQVLRAYYARLVGDHDEPQLRSEAAREFFSWEMAMMKAPGAPDDRGFIEWDGRQWTRRRAPDSSESGEVQVLHPLDARARMLAPLRSKLGAPNAAPASAAATVPARPALTVQKSRKKLRNPNSRLTDPGQPPVGGSSVPAQPMITAHFSVHDAFITQEPVLNSISTIRHIPCVAVHGARDVVCPVETLLDLHAAWPELKVCCALAAGHSMYDGDIAPRLIEATDRFRSLGREPEVAVGAASASQTSSEA